MTYKQASEYIDSFLIFGSKLGLTRITRLLEDLGNPQDKLKFVHVAGTNGKGSICSYCSAILKEAGYKAGLFTSPYIVDFRERFQINGEMISEKELCEIVEKIKSVVDGYPADEIPTEFEIVTAIGMMYFYKNNCDVVVLEVGLGGRFDSTNVIKKPLVSVIGSISIDHTAQLGNTVEKIAFEKAGIIKATCPTVLYPPDKESVLEVIKEQAEAKKSPLTIVNGDRIKTLRRELDGDTVSLNEVEIKLPISGIFQPLNLLTAVTALEKSGITVTNEEIKLGAEKAFFPARLQLVCNNPKILLDGAHNPDGIKALKEHIKAYFDKPTAIIGMMGDKDIDKVLSEIAPLFSKIYTVKVDNPRSLTGEELLKIAEKYNRNCFNEISPEQAIEKAKAENRDFVVCGSFYLCSQALKILNK